MSAPVDVLDTIRTLETLVRLHEGNLDQGVNGLLSRAEECCAAVSELIAERDRLANIVRDHEAQIIRMTAERAELMEAAKEALDTLEGCATEYGEDFGQRELRAALSRVQGGAE